MAEQIYIVALYFFIFHKIRKKNVIRLCVKRFFFLIIFFATMLLYSFKLKKKKSFSVTKCREAKADVTFVAHPKAESEREWPTTSHIQIE